MEAPSFLSTFSTNSPGELDVFRHDSNPLGMDCTQVGVLKQTHQVGFSRLLKSQNSMTLEPQISLEVLGNFTDKALEGQFADEKLSALLVLTDFTKGDGSRALQMIRCSRPRDK
jgi:hypothetical protein